MTPSYLLAHNLQTVTSMQPAAQVERIQTAFFSWIAFFTYAGSDGTTVTLMRWIDSGSMSVDWAIRVDTLTAVMLVVMKLHLLLKSTMQQRSKRPLKRMMVSILMIFHILTIW